MHNKKCKLFLSKCILIAYCSSLFISVPVSAGVPQNFSSLIGSSLENSSDYIKQQAEDKASESSVTVETGNEEVAVTFLAPDTEKEAQAKQVEEEMRVKNEENARVQAEKKAEAQRKKEAKAKAKAEEEAKQKQLADSQALLSKLMAEEASKPAVSSSTAGVPGSTEGKTPHQFVVTAYCNCVACNGQWAGGPTASGVMPRANHTIAVDPSVIPLGTKVVFNGIEYTAEDTGSAIIGNRIDLFFDDHQVAEDWGVQDVTVWY